MPTLTPTRLANIPIGCPWQMVAVDILEVPMSYCQNHYLLVIQEYFKGLNMTQHHAQLEKVALFSRGWKKNRDVREKQAQLGLPEHKLVGEVAT